MFADYRSQVLAFYARKKAENALSHRLLHASPANLKDECLEVCSTRYLRKDERALSGFFGKQDGKEGYLRAIKRLDTDKFRPPVNFLKGRVPGSDEKNVELVAWLIDFDQRPFEFGKQYGELDAANADVQEGEKAAVKGETEQLGRNEAVVEKATGQEAGEEAGMEDETEQEGKKDAGPGDGAEREGKKEAGPENKTAQAVVDAQETKSGDVGRHAPGGTEAQPSESAAAPRLFLLSGGKAQRMPWLKRRQLIMFILCLATMLAGAGVYLAFKFKWGMPPEGCMYWAGDHYERISCNEKKANTLIIAYDAEHLAHFRKITTPDTITYKAVGRVWYIKLNGNLEYFTADGYHPVEIHRKLHPITEYIIRTYLHPAADSTLISGGNGVTN